MNLFNFIEQTLVDGVSFYNPELDTTPSTGYMVVIKHLMTSNSKELKSNTSKLFSQKKSDLRQGKTIMISANNDDSDIKLGLALNIQNLDTAMYVAKMNKYPIYDVENKTKIKLNY